MSNVIAKEKLSAYQRWEMTSFEEATGDLISDQVGSNQGSSQPCEQAQKEVLTKDVEEGYRSGFNAGQQEGVQALQQEVAIFRKINSEFNHVIQHIEDSIAQDVLDVALDLAKAMLTSVLSLNPELIIPIVKEAIANLPSIQQPAHLILHPDDALIVNNKLGAELTDSGWIIVPDASLKRGDCRIDTATNKVDGSMAGRWKMFAAALGRDNAWYNAR